MLQRNGVEPDFMPIRVVDAQEYPSDRRSLNWFMINAERREPRSKRLDGAMAGGANCEVVEPSRGSGTVWIETQRQRWTTVGVLHGDAHADAVLDEFHHHLIAQVLLIPGAGKCQVCDGKLQVVNAVEQRCSGYDDSPQLCAVEMH
jgi:hypothetical protein